MPVIGKDIPYVPKEEKKGREIKIVKASIVHPSTILPSREISHEVMDSVKRDGVQQPIIVRPHPTIPNEYEIVDGHNRFYGVVGFKPDITHFVQGQEPEIWVDIRLGLTDSDVFRFSNTLHKRKGRNTYEKAEYYVKWIDAKAKELGEEKGALTAVAKEINPENPGSGQSTLSQYVKVYKLFKKLEEKHPHRNFNALKSIGVNRLYILTKLLDNLPELIKLVERLLKNPETSLDKIKDWVDRRRPPETKPTKEWSVKVLIKPYLTHSLHSTLCMLDNRISKLEKEEKSRIIKNVVCVLAKDFAKNSMKYKIKFEKDLRRDDVFTLERKQDAFTVNIDDDGYKDLFKLMRDSLNIVDWEDEEMTQLALICMKIGMKETKSGNYRVEYEKINGRLMFKSVPTKEQKEEA